MLRAGDGDRSGGVGEVLGSGFGEAGRWNAPGVLSLGKEKNQHSSLSTAGGFNPL